MKCILTSLAFTSFAMATLSSCEKERPIPHVETVSEAGITKADKPKYRTLVRDDATGEHSCPRPASNCTVMTFLTVNDDHGVGAVIDAIDSGNQQSVISAFTSKKHLLVNVIDESGIDAVINGRLIATAGHGADGARYLVLSSTTGVVEAAYPFKFE